MRWGYGKRGRFKVGFKVGFEVVSLFSWAHAFLCFLMDGHPQATAVLFPCSLSQGFKEAVMRITLFHSFSSCFVSCSKVYKKRGEYCIYRSQPVTEIPRMAGGGDVLYSRRR